MIFIVKILLSLCALFCAVWCLKILFKDSKNAKDSYEALEYNYRSLKWLCFSWTFLAISSFLNVFI